MVEMAEELLAEDMTIADVAKRLSISPDKLRKGIDSGRGSRQKKRCPEGLIALTGDVGGETAGGGDLAERSSKQMIVQHINFQKQVVCSQRCVREAQARQHLGKATQGGRQ
jgi:hypothetical protein